MNVAIPNLIAFDLVIVQPMSSMSGYINYVEYVAGSNKGATSVGDVFNDPFRLGTVDETYTSSKVVQTATGDNSTTDFAMKWAPVVPGTVEVTVGTSVYWDDGNGGLYARADIASRRFIGTTQNADGTLSGVAGKVECEVNAGATSVGTVEYGLANVKSTTETIYDTHTAAAVKFKEANKPAA